MPTTVSPQPPQTPPTPPKNWSKRRGRGGEGGFRGGLRGNTLGLAVARTPPWVASLGPRALLGEASGGQPRSQSLMGRSIRRPAQSLIGESFSWPPWIPEPYGGKRQAATLDPRAKWGEASGGHPGSQSLIGESISRPPRQSQIGGSLRPPPWIAEPYWEKPQAATLDSTALLGKASAGHPGSQNLIGGSRRRAPWIPEP